ncbi:unnamed protein product [Brachionus calyciflorus]|uniref:Uncharacterized protein n=1 Tax=Brachionus calyciflorus TaxID=104777 RepID=A0A814D3U4_9BILA|nr:unnamed protein product [Brachionus calyciflorus]
MILKILLLLGLTAISIVASLTCYSCSSCAPLVNGNIIICSENDTNCYVGSKPDYTIDQGCTSNFSSIYNKYSSWKLCVSSNCNKNTFDNPLYVTSTTRTNNAKQIRISFKIVLFAIFSSIVTFFKKNNEDLSSFTIFN